MLRKLVLASHNSGKLREFRELLSPLGIEVISAGELQISEPEETGDSFAANARLKALHSAKAANLSALSDDSGLVIPAIGGAPGIYSARWAGPNKDFSIAFERIKNELQAAHAPLNSEAYFVCVLSLCTPDGACHEFEGRIYGTLTFPARGNRGFGYDPIFTPRDYNVTFAEIDPAIKNDISHRAQAFTKFLDYIGSLPANS